jgi:AraC-like DNA-binding protein
MEKDRQQTVPNVLKRLAHLLGTELKGNRLEIPQQLGKGYCAGFIFNKHIRMVIFNYELNESFVIENPDVKTPGKMILFKFQNIIPESKTLKAVPSVLITTSRMNTDALISIDTHTAAINIEVDAAYLNGQFDLSEKSPILQSLLQNTQPLLFEQVIYPSLQTIVDEIMTESVGETFELLFLRIKAEELICSLLMELEKRDGKHLCALNIQDIQAIYKVKEQILEHLETPPVLQALAAVAHMSPSKLKRLFKQIFGNSIFSYYQGFRMKEAARLLKEEKLSVSDAGYGLGFTNLSHFSKVFKEHIGMKPKQYSRTEIQQTCPRV